MAFVLMFGEKVIRKTVGLPSISNSEGNESLKLFSYSKCAGGVV